MFNTENSHETDLDKIKRQEEIFTLPVHQNPTDYPQLSYLSQDA